MRWGSRRRALSWIALGPGLLGCTGSSASSADAGGLAPGPSDARDGGYGCPAQFANASDDLEPCAPVGAICEYPAGQCICEPRVGIQWSCLDRLSGCPEAHPIDGGACSSGGLMCVYWIGYDAGPDAEAGAFGAETSCCNGKGGLWEPLPADGCPTGNACGTIRTSDYDQTCTVDSDCVAVDEGDLCVPNRCDCASAVISARAQAQYELDYSAKLSVVPAGHCACPPDGNPFCNHGVCALPY